MVYSKISQILDSLVLRPFECDKMDFGLFGVPAILGQLSLTDVIVSILKGQLPSLERWLRSFFSTGGLNMSVTEPGTAGSKVRHKC